MIRDWLRKLLGGRGCRAIELAKLCRGRASDSERLTFRHNLAHEPDLLCLGGVKAASGKDQVAHHSISQVSFKPRNAAKSWKDAKPKLRKAEACRLVGNDEVANQRQFQTAAEDDSVHGRN